MENATLSGPGMRPASGNEAKQLVVFLHGLGANGDDLIGLGPELAEILPDAAFVSPNAPFACDMAPYGYQWFSMLQRDPEFIHQGVMKAAPILNDYLDSLLAHFTLPEDKLALVGFSQGTMMSLYVALRRARPMAGIVGFSGALVAPDTLAAEIKSRPPVCLIHGDADPVVPFAMLGFAEKALKSQNVTVEAHTRPGLPHGIDGEGIEIAAKFLKKRFGL